MIYPLIRADLRLEMVTPTTHRPGCGKTTSSKRNQVTSQFLVCGGVAQTREGFRRCQKSNAASRVSRACALGEAAEQEAWETARV